MDEIFEMKDVHLDGDAHVFNIELTAGLMEAVSEGILSRLGINKKSTIDQKIEKFLADAYSATREAVKIKGMYRFVPVRGLKKDRVETSTGPIISTRFANMLKKSNGERHILFSILTIGEYLETKFGQEKSIMKQTVVDTIGSQLIERATDQLEVSVQRAVNKLGMHSTARFSPGYCDWSLSGEEVIFKCLSADQIGITLSEQFVMKPGKSISGISVIAQEIPSSVPCTFCKKEYCPWKRNAGSKNNYRNKTRLL